MIHSPFCRLRIAGPIMSDQGGILLVESKIIPVRHPCAPVQVVKEVTTQ